MRLSCATSDGHLDEDFAASGDPLPGGLRTRHSDRKRLQALSQLMHAAALRLEGPRRAAAFGVAPR